MKEKKGEHPFGDAGQLISMGVFLIVWIGDSFFLRRSTFLHMYVSYYLRLIILGCALLAGFYLYSSGHSVVSHTKRPVGVRKTGSFRLVRHPLYLASLLFYLGLTIATMSLISFVLFVVIFIFYNYIAGYEEKLMEAKFGEEYTAYKKRTGKWVPKTGK